jgi:hypothetical protein
LRTRGIAVLIGVLAAASIVAGCGGGGDSSSGPTISKAVFIKKADAVCLQGNKRMEVAFAHFLQENKNVKRPDDAKLEKLVGTILVPNVKREVKELHALGAPSGDEDRVGEIVKALEEGLETAEGNPQAAVNSSEVVFGIASRLAKEYGLEVCGSR